MLISIETDITCDISRGSGPPIPTSGSVHDWIRIGGRGESNFFQGDPNANFYRNGYNL